MIINMIMYIIYGLCIIFVGSFIGFISGFLGIGGGIIIVPILYQIFLIFKINHILSMQIAIATSLSVISITKISTSISYCKNKIININIIKYWGPGLFIGSSIGTAIGIYNCGNILHILFSLMTIILSLNMIFFITNKKQEIKILISQSIYTLISIIVGFLSAIIGVGGGIICVPIFNMIGYSMQYAIGFSSIMSLIISIPAVIGYIIFGFSIEGRPPFSIGYVHLLSVFLLIPMTILCAPIGVKVSNKFSQKYLRLLFAVFLTLTSLNMFYQIMNLKS